MSAVPGILINGTMYADSLVGTAGDDTINAGTGVDTIQANSGDDRISIVVADEFSDTVHGGDGVDSLLVTVQDTSGSYWMPANMYWVGYDAGGNAIGMITVGSNYDMAYADLALSGVRLKLNTGNGYPGAWIDGIENLSLWTSQRDDSNDMLLLRGTGTYNGYGGFNGMYADWSALATPIVWHNQADATVQSVGGSSISNVQRLLLRSGAGDDDIRNTAVTTDDEFETGAGNDTVYAGQGKDRVDTGAGDDYISVVVGSEFADTVRGGSGTDTLVVTAIVPQSAEWQSKNMYFVGYDAQGAVTGQASAGSSTMANADAALAGVSLKLNTGNAYPGVLLESIENLTLLANPSEDSHDMLFVIGTGTYNGYAGADALYANWSGATADIRWNNLASSAAQAVNGSTISNVERLLVRTGSGNDDIRNTAVATDDEFETGAGNDTIHAGGGRDRVDAGSGDDFVSVVVGSEFADTVHGGAGTDTLIVTAVVPESAPWQSKSMYFVGYDAEGVATGSASAGSSTMANADAALAGVSLKLNTGNAYPGVLLDGIEDLTLLANPSDDSHDMLFVIGTGTYNGYAGTDALFADWSSATADIVWTNLADGTAHEVQGSMISNVERLLVRSGSGNDELRNLVAGTNDEFETGAGHDRVYAGAGNDRILGGSGNDTIDGGAGTDTAVFSGARALYTVTRNAAGTSFVVTSAAEGSDWLSLVESFQFADLTMAASTFTTQDTTAPSVVGVSPADEATGVATTTDIVGSFDEAIQRGSGSITLKNAAGATIESFDAASSARISIAGSTLTVDPSAQLASMTGYRLEFAAGSIKDLLGNGIALIDSYNFTTGLASYTGTTGNDVLTGDDYANTFTGLAGDDAIDGLGGTDTAVYTGARADYTISLVGAVRRVNDSLPGRDGNDSLSSIERLRFADAAVAYDMDGNAGTVAKLVGALFGASALHDAALVGSYLSLLDDGASALEVAALALASARFAQLAGSHGNADFVDTVYENVAGVAPGTAERNELVSLLDSGAVTQATLALLAAEHPLNQARIDLAGLAGTGLGYGLAAAGTVQFGTSGPDALSGTSAADQLYGLAGNDTFSGGTGNDSLDGGDGIDRAVFAGASSHFGWSREDSGWSVMDARGPYTIDLVGIERLQFEDRHVALDIDGAAGMTAKLLGAVFGAPFVANPEFVGIGLSVFDAGMTYEQVAQLALDARLGAGHTHQQAVELMYTHLIGLPPSPQDSAELVALIDVYHLFTEASLAVFAAELPYNTDNIDLVGLSQTGIEFVPA